MMGPEMESLTLTDDHHPLMALPISPETPSIDPPSYADVIFSPNGSDPSEHNSNARHVIVSVSDPQKEPGPSPFVSYLVTTAGLGPDSPVAVRRRFRDVVALSDRLAESYRGFFIPPRPEKNVMESQLMQKQEFVEQRRLALEKYLRRLVSHPVLGKSDEIRVFLLEKGRLPLNSNVDVASRMLDGAVRLPKQLMGEAGPSVEEAVQPAKGGRDLMRIWRELRQSVANDWGGSKPLAVEEDREFLERKEKMQDLEVQLTSASREAEALVKAQQDIGETMGELGLTLIKLTKFETEEAVYNTQRIRAADIKRVATAAVKASRFYREFNAHTVKHLDTLHEYLGLMLAVQAAFSDRTSALLTVQTLLSDLSSLQAKAEKLEAATSKIFGADKSRIRKMEELKESIRATEDAKMVALREYERIKENNRSELERIDRERHDDFTAMLKGFVINQVGYADKIADVWDAVAQETSSYANQGR